MSSIPLNSWRFCRDEDPVLARESRPEWTSDWVAGRGSSMPPVPLFARPDFDDSAWCYGYTPFRVDFTPWVNPDGENVLAVRTYNPPQSSRWSTGAGLYRECRLVVEPADAGRSVETQP